MKLKTFVLKTCKTFVRQEKFKENPKKKKDQGFECITQFQCKTLKGVIPCNSEAIPL